MQKTPLALLVAAALTAPAFAFAQNMPPISDAPYPGTLVFNIDATDLAHRVFKVREEIPAKPGPLRLFYPKWIPGGHGPYGAVHAIGGLKFTANGKDVPWKRDPLDIFSFWVDVPEGATGVTAEFQFLSPIGNAPGRVVMTPEIVGLQWDTVALYPAGYRADQIQAQASVLLPQGWGFGTALDVDGDGGNTAGATPVRFKPTSFYTLQDSPVLAGKYYKRIDLTPAGSTRPVSFEAVADKASDLDITPEVLKIHKELIVQAYKLYGSQHFRHYRFLVSISSKYSGIGLEHHESTESSLRSGYLQDVKKLSGTDVIPHEFGHSWNGKFRRGADLNTPNYNEPMQDSLLWVYEGQNQYWGQVLGARSGMRTPENVRDGLASLAAGYQMSAGRQWRSLLDTTNQPIVSDRDPQAWRSYQRGEDYYSEGQLIWLDADTLIREMSGGKRSLDDFAKRFFGVEDGRIAPLNYTFDDVVANLNAVQPYDWATFLHDRVDRAGAPAPLDGITRGGWKLVFNDKQSETAAAFAARGGGGTSFNYGLGLSVNGENKISDVRWDSPAFQAGLAPGMTIVAVNGMAASGDALTDAVKAAAKEGNKDPIELLVNNADHIITVKIDYHGGLRYPHLERIPGKPDLITLINAPKK
jgi:predicted metalloprotease with PDZ domain